ncbi:hypothetical protein ACAG26_12740 [Mycobacterium sp. pUA109]|uniref:hypothetical protein n=1 Tax=Mycobacterium sp. pUA109 TaxID=3238982 RepID=UPI00351B8D1A
MSRRFARVGVDIPAARLQQTAAGAAATPDELIAIQFALVATETRREERQAAIMRLKRRGIQWLIVAGLVLATLNLLACMVYGFVTMVLHDRPF